MTGWKADVPPSVVAAVDQWAAACRDHLREGVAVARILVDYFGPTMAARILRVELLAGDPERLAQSLSWTLVTLAEQQLAERAP